MKTIFAFFALALSASNIAHACPNLSGEYAFEKAFNGTEIIEQTDCSTIKITLRRPVDKSPTYPDGVWTFTYTRKIDGQKYDGMYDSLQLATPDTYDSHTSEFINNRLVMRQYEGQQSKCGDKYAFTSFDCKLFERSFGYDDELKSFTEIQVAGWRSDHDYENSVFLLKKIR